MDAEDPDDRTICVYYAGIDLPSERLALARFAEGKAKLMITTVAFGLGINIPDVRRVYHYGASATVLEYWQEIGRCGRDGSQGRAILIDCFVPGFQSPIPTLIRDCEEKNKCFRVALLSYLWVGNNNTPQVPSSTCCSFCMLYLVITCFVNCIIRLFVKGITNWIKTTLGNKCRTFTING